MKKNGKLVTLALFTFLMGSVPAFAREMTLQELGEEASKIQKDAGYVYIIGDYAFTSKFNIKTQDIMLASTTLKIQNPTDSKRMVINQITRTYDDNYVAIGWAKGTNALGTTTLPEKFNISYIDYVIQPDKSKAEINIDLSNDKFSEYTDVLSKALGFKASEAYGNGKLEFKDGKVSGLLLQDTKITLSASDQTKYNNPKYFFAYVLEVPNASSKTKITTSGMGHNGEIKWDSFDIQDEEGKTPGVVVLVPVDPTEWEKDKDKTLTITVDVDGEGKYYEPVDYKLDLSGLKFQQDSTATLADNTNGVSQEDLDTLENWGYTFPTNKKYNLTQDGENANNYKLTGKIEPQLLNANGWSKEEQNGYFFLFTLKKPDELESVPEGVKVTVTGSSETKTFGKEYFNEEGIFVDLFKLNPNCESDCKITIKVDWDGDGEEYLESKEITISYNKKELVFEKSSKFSVESIDGSGETALDEAYGWKKPDKFGVKFDTTGTTVKVTGLLPILESFENGKDPFEDDEATGYYLPFVIKTLDKTTNGSDKVTVQFIHKGEEGKTITSESFDENNVLYILRHLDKKATDKTFEIVVDMDGDGEEYAPYTITFDWSELKLQEKTVAEVKVNNASAADKEQLKGYGYKSEVNSDVKISGTAGNYTLEGKLVEQVLNDNVFAEKTGYYFDFTFKLPEGVKPENVKISHLTDGTLNDNSKIKKTFKDSEYDKQDNSLTILYQFTEDPNCKTNSGNCKLYYSVDYDGEGDEYLPTLVTIDYSKLTFEKSSLFTVVAIDDTNKSQYDDDGWYNEDDGYSVEVVKDDKDPNKYKVSGVLPILEDSDWDGNDAPFEDDGSLLYYLGLGLKLTNAPKDYNSQGDKKINILFEHDAESKNFSKIFGDDFDTSSTVYILKALKATNEDGSHLKDSEKWFTITVDLDGDDNDEYAPYEVTIDYSELKFQDSSSGASFDLLDTENLDDNSPEKEELEGYDFDSTTVKEVKAKLNHEQPDREPYIEGIEGTIKEQTLQSGFTNNKGYFVPIKISVPKDEDWFADYKNTWELILNTESGEEKTYQPTHEEYEQGWVMVLFRLNDKSTKEIKYKIDFDGEGKAFLPDEYTIKYDDLVFEALDKITYNYRDNNGQQITETASVYQNEEIKLKDLSDIATDYRTFEGWYKEDGTKVEGNTLKITEDKDETLTAHWNLNAEKFVEDVIKDLNSDDTTHSKKFNDEFVLEQEKNNITVDIKKPNVSLDELSKTSIPGAIAYILEKGEVKDITLTVEGKEKVFTKDYSEGTGDTLKEKIISEAKTLFDNEETATLDKLEFDDEDDKIFTIKIGDTIDEATTLVKSDGTEIKEETDKTYTFKFDSDFVVVDEDAKMGAKDINTAINDDKNYSTVYIDGDINLTETLNIETSNNVTIKPVEEASGISLASATPTTISVTEKDYAIDVKSGNITFENVKITGGKYGELKIEKGATVTANNVDVSGTIEESTSGDNDDMHAAIVVDGVLTASNITNTDEKYSTPTIALVTSYSYPSKDLHGEDEDEGDSGNIHPGAKVTISLNNMTRNDKYYIVESNDSKHVDSIKESYYGSFYYVNNNNSQIYFMTVIDRQQTDGGITFFKVYNYDDNVDFSSLGYEVNKENKDKVFEKLHVEGTGKDITDDNAKVQEVLQSHITNKVVATYKEKPKSALNLKQSNGLKVIGNKLSGTLETQNDDGKYIIPVTLTSEYFEDNKSTVKVTDPNNVTKTYTYKSGTENGIATVSTVNTMKLELEAIKSSNIKGANEKVYEITVDVDGDDTEYEAETYTIDYSDVETLEEKINAAAQNTLNSKSFTVTKDNHINGYTEAFIYEYNSELGLTHLTSTKDNVEEYTFSLKYVGKEDSKASVVTRKQTKHEEGKVYINDWEYIHPIQVGRAIQEVTMLTDVMGETYINAIDKVKLADGKAHTYIATLNRDKYNDWVKKNYLSNSKYSSAEWALNEIVEVEVELDDNEQYIKSIKTSQKSSDNTFNVTFENVNSTEIKAPKEFLAENDKALTEQDIIDFYNKGIKWWEDYTGATVYSE